MHALALLTALITTGALSVDADFEGGSVRVLSIDQASSTISFMPGGQAERGWPCWWYFRVSGVQAGQSITLRLHGSDSVATRDGKQGKPLSPSWSTPGQACFSTDGKSWQKTAGGKRDGEWMIYTLEPAAESFWVAWGPPYTPGMAANYVKQVAERCPAAKAEELCRSREGRAVPMLHVQEGEKPSAERFGVWVQARQHAWESGSSWVAQGFAEWLVSDKPEAAWLRQNAEVVWVPIMDIDNTATGNGGKDAIPQDHNRDWSAAPHWNEVSAAQKQIGKLISENRLAVFLDLHNPAPDDPTFFYVLPDDQLQPEMLKLRNHFIDLAYGRISKLKPLIPMSNKPKITGPGYHPLWRQMSVAWVTANGNPQTMSVCLETIWNSKSSTPEGYQAVGSALAASVHELLSERAK